MALTHLDLQLTMLEKHRQTIFKMPALLLDVTYTPLSCRNNPRHVIRKIVLGARPENLEIMRNGDNLQARRLVEYWDQSGIPTTLYLDDKCDRCLQKHKEVIPLSKRRV